jgi:hypothetical protein
MEIFGTHIDFIQVLLAVVAFFLIRTLNKIDKNQGLLFGKLNNVEARLNRLLGAHEVNHSVLRHRSDNFLEDDGR